MLDLYLDFSSKREVVNFLSHWLAFAGGDFRKHADSFIEDYDTNKEVDLVVLQNFIKEFAKEILPTRLALTDFFANKGAGIEWSRVENTVRRSVAVKMRKFKASGEAETIDQLFKDDDFDTIFSEDEKLEIQHVRHQLMEDYYLANKNKLQSIVAETENKLNAFNDLIFLLRDCASNLPTMLQEELYSKITRFEDRFYFNGEDMDLDLLKEELHYYTDHKEAPIE